MCDVQGAEPLERYEDGRRRHLLLKGSPQVLTLYGTLPAPARTFGDALLAIPCSRVRSFEE
jgi:hypothetical protein